MQEKWVEIFGMWYRRRFFDEQHDKVLRFDKRIFVTPEYLEEMT